jgi:hypothetical protein
MRKIELNLSLLLLSLLASLAVNSQLNAMESGYLDAIKADYNEFNSGSFAPPSESTWIGSAGSDSSTSNLAYEKLQDFSLYLREVSPGTFIFYDNLPAKYKNQLHQQYLKTGNLDEIKKDIFKYSNEIKKTELK